nr:MAG TPA: hypothetical protein [Caudoviricetes sp.]
MRHVKLEKSGNRLRPHIETYCFMILLRIVLIIRMVLLQKLILLF